MPFLLVVNQDNSIFRMRRSDNKKWGVKAVRTRLRITSQGPADRLSMAMPSSNSVVLFWVKEDKTGLKGVIVCDHLDQSDPVYSEVDLKLDKRDVSGT